MSQQKNEKNLPIQISANSVSVQQMIQYILKQINDISQTDIRIINPDEIINIYNQLINENVQEIQELNNINQSNKKDEIHISYHQKQCASQGSKDYKQMSSESMELFKPSQQSYINQKTRVEINGSYYFTPKCLSRDSYKIANKRYSLICRPEPDSIQQKRKLVSQSYSPVMMEIIKTLKDQQIQQTYENLKIINRSQLYLSQQRKQDKYTQIKPFVIYAPKQQITKEELHKLKTKQNKQNIYQSSKIQSKKKQIIQEQMDIEHSNNFFYLHHQFFDEVVHQKTQKNIQYPTNKKQQKRFENQQSIKQTIKSVKNKDKIQNSSQTDLIKMNKKKTKSKITVVSQVQYIDDNNDDSPKQNNQSSHTIDINDQIKIGVPQKKIFLQNFQNALINPKDMPNPQIIKWINNMKNILGKLQYEYLNQFKSNWVVINQ